MSNFKSFIEINKKAWNKRTPIHLNSNFYQNIEFKKKGNSLKNIELKILNNLKNQDLLHLQCHFGQDSISLAKMGAHVTAVDFSDIAIKEAKKISKEMGVNVNFIENNVLELNLKKEFDIIFSSYGTIGWLPDLDQWGKIVAKHLKRGGLFLLTEFHPFITLLDNDQYDYFYKELPDQEKKLGSYTDGGKTILIEDCWWNHSLTDIFTALEKNGLKLTSFEEFDYCPYLLEGMIRRKKGEYVLEKRAKQKLPYVYNLTATKK
tara:strand:- start:4225 stop:5010 length:786 start_codon:yes stop_codon:yes gene_type:complete